MSKYGAFSDPYFPVFGLNRGKYRPEKPSYSHTFHAAPVFFIWVFFHAHSRFTGQQGKGEGIYLTPLYHFHPLHRHLDINRAIIAKRVPVSVNITFSERIPNFWRIEHLELCPIAKCRVAVSYPYFPHCF